MQTLEHAAPFPAKPPWAESRLVLVVGAPRSATRTFSRRLHKSGVRADHERVGRGGSVSSYFAVDDYWYQGPHGQDRRRNYTFTHVWHLVRDPLKTINSLAAGMPVAWWHWQEKHSGVSADEPRLRGAMRFWLRWNQICEPQTDFRVRFEESDSRWGELCERLGVAPVTLPEIHAHQRAVPLAPLSWDALKSEDAPLTDAIREMAVRYGYKEHE